VTFCKATFNKSCDTYLQKPCSNKI